MVKSHRRRFGRTGLVCGLLALACAAGVAIAAGALLGLRFISVGDAALGLFLPAAALVAIGVTLLCLSRIQRRAYRVPPAHMRLGQLAAEHRTPHSNVFIPGRCALPANQAPAGRWEA